MSKITKKIANCTKRFKPIRNHKNISNEVGQVNFHHKKSIHVPFLYPLKLLTTNLY